MKKVNIIIFIITGIFLFALFFGLNYIEAKNNCTITVVRNIPFVACIEFLDDSNFGNNPYGHFRLSPRHTTIHKPLILLYPQKDTVVNVQLNYQPGFSATFPKYNEITKGWSVLSHPDGTLVDYSNNQETYGIFWEGYSPNIAYNLSRGFVVEGSEVREFLYTKLQEIGLNTKEYSDFIMYWYPKLQDYPYVQISFVGKEYTNVAQLDITPKPDSLLRVFMVAKPLSKYKSIQPQIFKKFKRNGFSVVEWGGTIVQ